MTLLMTLLIALGALLWAYVLVRLLWRIADDRACQQQARMLQEAAAQRIADDEAQRRSLLHYAAMAALRRNVERAKEAGAQVLTDNTLRNAGGNHGASLAAQYTMRGDNAGLQDHVPAATDAGTSAAQ